ncbi:MAG: hypothetical protein ACFFB3_03060 [Candidatus Hodarchaeota archaeon]
MFSKNITPKKIIVLILYAIALVAAIWSIGFNFFDKGVDIDTLKQRLIILSIGVFAAAIAGLISITES